MISESVSVLFCCLSFVIYIDFRSRDNDEKLTGDTSDEESNHIKERNAKDGSSNYDYQRDRKGDFSHLIIWQVPILTWF